MPVKEIKNQAVTFAINETEKDTELGQLADAYLDYVLFCFCFFSFFGQRITFCPERREARDKRSKCRDLGN